MLPGRENLLAILRDEFEKALRFHGDFSIVDENASADAEMVLFVNRYGFAQSSSRLSPFINVSASLRKPDGTVIWQRTDVVLPQDRGNTCGYSFEEYIEKPEFLREAWSCVSGVVSRNLVDELSD